MIGLFDRDVFYKLALCKLWEPCLSVLGIDEPFRLVSAGSYRSSLSRKFTGEQLSIAETLVKRVVENTPVIPDALTSNIEGTESFQSMGGTEGIDGGERILASIVFNSPSNGRLITGDKKFLKALKESHPEYWEIMGDSIVSFEYCVIRILNDQGFDFIRSRAFAMRFCDNSLRLSFGEDNSEEEFRRAINSFAP